MALSKQLKQIAQTLLPATYLIWAGLILGVSFIATPVKFQAPHLSMPVALEVGKATFRLFNTVEWGFIIAAIIMAIISGNILKIRYLLSSLLIILGIQTLWILPGLYIYADAVIEGHNTPPYGISDHRLYILTEVLKLLITLWAAGISTRKVIS